jgi:hypothetical protein
MEVIFTQLAARSPVNNFSHAPSKIYNLDPHPMKIYKLQHILSLSFNIWNVYFHKRHVRYIKHNCSTNRQLLTGKIPTKSRLADCIQYPAAE